MTNNRRRLSAVATTAMDAFGVQFRINDDRRFGELCSLYAKVKRDKDAGAFRDPQEWVGLVPDVVKGSFEWPTADERARWLSVRDVGGAALPGGAATAAL